MPWRKYPSKEGKYGPMYTVAPGVQVRKDKRGKWTLFIEKSGKRKNKTFGEGREGLNAAIKAAEKVVARIDDLFKLPKNPVPSRRPKTPLFKDYSQRWLRDNANRWSPYTADRYDQILRLHIWPDRTFHAELSAIGRKQLKSFLKGVARRVSPSTVEAIHGVISGIFNEAFDDELVQGNPAAGLLKGILPPENRRDLKSPDPFNQEELQLFLSWGEKIGSEAEAMMLKVMAYAGLRLGETLAMRREHFNAEQRTYYVAQSYRQGRFSKPKAGKTRLVDLPVFLTEEMIEYCRTVKKKNLQTGLGARIDYLFVDPDDRGRLPYSQRKVQSLVRRVCQAASLRVRNPHDLRHTYATLLLMAHQSPGYVQKQLGHSSISITMDEYCHWVPGEGRGDLDAVLGGGRGGVLLVPNPGENPPIFPHKKERPQ